MQLLTALACIGAVATGVQAIAAPPKADCKCVPSDKCWPKECSWDMLKGKVGGKLIKTEPTADACYPDQKDFNLAECARVTGLWSDQDFQTSLAIGRPYPYNITCPPVNYDAGEEPVKDCILGSLPVYAVNATTVDDIKRSLLWSQKHNVRLVISGTGHDLLGRSDGYGSLEIWLHHFRNGIDFQQKFQSDNKCYKSGWDGSALHIKGAYQWKDVYAVAKANDVIVVGGGSPSVGAIGGWASGGGHGPASRNYGLGSDQLLELEVMLASGEVVTANACTNSDLYRAMRGGGPGYGIVLSTKVKAHPNVDVVTAHTLAIAPLVQTPENADLLDAMATILQGLPDLNEKGFAGYGFWFRNFPGPFVNNTNSGYSHGFWTIGKGQEEADAAFAPLRAKLDAFKEKLFIFEDFRTYPDYWSFYEAESGLKDAVGDTSILTSRLMDSAALEDYEDVRDMVEVVSGAPEDFAANVILLVSGGQVFEDADDKFSGLLPAWRRSPFALVTGRGIPKTASNEVRKAVADDVTLVKGGATKKLAPNTGGYMNEGDRNDPEYIKSFYGANYPSHLAAKKKYDPKSVFFCPTCVGSEAFVDRQDGALCKVK